MAVQQARHHLAHDFPAAMGGALFLDEYAGGCAPAAAAAAAAQGAAADTAVLRDFPRSDLACGYGGGLFEPRKRPRVSAPGCCFLEDQHSVLAPAAVAQGLLAPAPLADVRSRALGSAAASTSGQLATVSRGLLSWQGADIDALITLESERMRLGLEQARRRHARALLAAAARAASGRLRAAEAGLGRALRRAAELEEKARQVGAECQAWEGVARSHEAVAAGLRAALDQLLLRSPRAAAAPAPGPGDGDGDAEDAQSCCFEPAPAPAGGDGGRAAAASLPCKSCGGGDACVLVLPCRHLCLCRACEAAVDACPVCAANKNGSLLVLFS